ncbi:MAG: response regulator, partial [bacterium]
MALASEIVPLDVLFIEDSPVDAKIFQGILSKSRYFECTVSHAKSMAEAAGYLQSHEYDIIVTDLGLPDSNGCLTVVNIRKEAESAPILVLTGDDGENRAINMLRVGAQDYLVKGKYDPASLDRAIRYAMERQKLFHDYQDTIEKLRRANERHEAAV